MMPYYRWVPRRMAGQTEALQRRALELAARKQTLESEWDATDKEGDEAKKLRIAQELSAIETELFDIAEKRRTAFENKEQQAVALVRSELEDLEYKAEHPAGVPLVGYRAATREVHKKRAEYLEALKQAAILEQHRGWTSTEALPNTKLVQSARNMDATTDFLYQNFLYVVNYKRRKSGVLHLVSTLEENKRQALQSDFPRYFAPAPQRPGLFRNLLETFIVRQGGRAFRRS